MDGEDLQEIEDEELGELELLEEGEEELEYEADPLDLWDPLDAPSSQLLSIAVSMSFLIFSTSPGRNHKMMQDVTTCKKHPS